MVVNKIKHLISTQRSKVGLLVFVLVFGVLGVYFLLFSHASSLLPGDLNSDNTVNVFDLSILLSHWQQIGTGIPEDLNTDGAVNIFDLSILLSNYGKTASSAGPVISLNSSDNTISWPAINGATGYQGATSNGPRSDSTRTTTYSGLGNVTSWTPPEQCGQTLYYGVNDNGDNQWSANEVSITWPACSSAKLRVSVNNTDGWGAPITPVSGYPGSYVSNLFTDIGVSWNRFAVSSGSLASDMSIVDSDAYGKVPAMKTFIVYQGFDADGNGRGLTPAQVTSDMNTLIPLLQNYFAKTGQPPELEFLNESYQTLNAATYAALYHAAHVLTAPAGIKLIGTAGTTTANVQNGGNGNWFTDLAAHLPGGAAELDGIVDHPYPPSSDVFGSQSTADTFYLGWTSIQHTYAQAVAAGFVNQPWYFTEVGSALDWGISQNQQAADVTYILDQVSSLMNGTNGWPNVVFVNWFAAFDDAGSGQYGLLNSPVTAPSVRPSFTALKNWVATHASQIQE